MEETMRLALIVLALFLGTAPASAWEEYVYLDQGVAIQFPAVWPYLAAVLAALVIVALFPWLSIGFL
jgi:hypothetical protein